MEIYRTGRFKKDFKGLPSNVQEQAAKTLEMFLANSRYPALRIKKMEGAPGIWEMRVSDNYRITFQFVDEGILLRRIGSHNILRQA